jgi:hypothetical protein
MPEVAQFEKLDKEELKVEFEQPSIPFVWTRVMKDMNKSILSAGVTFSEQMFASGENRYVQSYTEVTEPTIVESNEIKVNQNKRFTLPIMLPSLITWVCSEWEPFTLHINEKEIPCQDRGLVLFPSWIDNVEVQPSTRGQTIQYGSCSVPLKHKE